MTSRCPICGSIRVAQISPTGLSCENCGGVSDDALERAAGVPNTGNCPKLSMPTHRDDDTAC